MQTVHSRGVRFRKRSGIEHYGRAILLCTRRQMPTQVQFGHHTLETLNPSEPVVSGQLSAVTLQQLDKSSRGINRRRPARLYIFCYAVRPEAVNELSHVRDATELLNFEAGIQLSQELGYSALACLLCWGR
jgi:hypothetical protein